MFCISFEYTADCVMSKVLPPAIILKTSVYDTSEKERPFCESVSVTHSTKNVNTVKLFSVRFHFARHHPTRKDVRMVRLPSLQVYVYNRWIWCPTLLPSLHRNILLSYMLIYCKKFLNLTPIRQIYLDSLLC